MKKVIRLKESDLKDIIKRILSEQSKENINPNNLKVGDGGRRNPKKKNLVKQLQQKLMDLELLKTGSMIPTGYFGGMTKDALDMYNGKVNKDAPIYALKNPNQNTSNPNKNQKQGTYNPFIPLKNTKQGTPNTKQSTSNTKYNCIAIPKEECDRINSTSDTVISTGADKACAKYMNKCLSKYDKDLSGHAWTALNNLKYRGVATEKYNMFKKDINWNGLWRDLEKYKVTNKSCECHKEDHADKHCNTGIAKSIENSYPSKTGFDISSLELGDIVGMYYSPSTNKGMAFCQKASFDKNGKIIKTSPFEFNTHIGFVVAIKDGVPIILHNIGNETQGLRHATPATKLLSKNGTMIAWVAKDNEMKKGLYFEKFRKGIKNDLPGFKNLPPGFIK
jgi:hypothetical protein